jgi:Bacteriophage related domain of unknown function
MGYIATANIQITLDTQLKTVAGLPAFSVENQEASANGVTPFCRSTLAPAKSTIESLGMNKIIKSTGLYAVDLYFPISYGYMPGRQMADAVINAFPPGQLLMPDGVNNLIILTAWSQPGSGYTDDGNFWGIPIRVEWQIYAAV